MGLREARPADASPHVNATEAMTATIKRFNPFSRHDWEKAGDKIEDAAEQVGDAFKDTAEDAGKKLEPLAEQLPLTLPLRRPLRRPCSTWWQWRPRGR